MSRSLTCPAPRPCRLGTVSHHDIFRRTTMASARRPDTHCPCKHDTHGRTSHAPLPCNYRISKWSLKHRFVALCNGYSLQFVALLVGHVLRRTSWRFRVSCDHQQNSHCDHSSNQHLLASSNMVTWPHYGTHQSRAPKMLATISRLRAC